MGRLNPTTKVTVVCSPNKKPWLDKVWYFRAGCSCTFITEIAGALDDAVYAQRETIDRPLTLYVVRTGVVAHDGVVKMRGDSWGEDFILAEDPEYAALVHDLPAVALTYCHAVMLAHSRLRRILRHSGDDDRAHLRHAVLWIVLKKKIQLWASDTCCFFTCLPSGCGGGSVTSARVAACRSHQRMSQLPPRHALM